MTDTSVVALLPKRRQRSAYEDLGTESIKKLEVEGFPAIVACDMHGGDLLLQGKDE